MTQEKALEILKAGHSVYLTGAAGSGKTYLLNKYIGFLRNKGIGVGVTASTGIAATHIGGLTIHSWAGIGISRSASDEDIKAIAANRRIAKRFANTETLIIDEISMLDADRLSLVERVARAARGSRQPFGGMQMIFCGDFFQLPPIAKDKDNPSLFAYHSSAWKELDPKVCYLSEQFRQKDGDLSELLNAIRCSQVNEGVRQKLLEQKNSALAGKKITKLYSHNVDVDAENLRELQRLPGEEANYYMESSGSSAILKSLKGGCLAPDTLILKKGAKVMFVKNNFEEGYVNGTLGEVSGFDERGYPIVTTLKGKKIFVAPESWSIEENGRTLAKITQIPLRLAWAITIHKSQGMTLDAAEINLADAFEKGMGYVALSRVQSLDGLKLIGFNEVALQVHPEILEFDEELRKNSEGVDRDFVLVPSKKESVEEKNSKTYSVEKVRERHPVAYQKWTSEEEKLLSVGFKAGKKIPQLAKEFGRQAGGIRSRLKKMGLKI